jgi:hypothetical protein
MNSFRAFDSEIQQSKDQAPWERGKWRHQQTGSLGAEPEETHGEEELQ